MSGVQILAGGVFCDPWPFDSIYLEQWYAATKPEVFYKASQYIQPARHTDPDFGEVMGMRLRLARNDQAVSPLTDFYRTEARANNDLVPWGTPCTYYWRGVVGDEFLDLGAGSKVIILQAHDTNLDFIDRFPTFDGSIDEDKLRLRFSRDSVPTGEVVYEKTIAARMPIEITMQIMWADDYHVSGSQGWYRIYDGDALVAEGSGLNTWLDPDGSSEPWCPFQKWGVYQAGYNYAWWQGKAMNMIYSAAFVASGAVSPADCRAYTGTRLLASAAGRVGVL